MAGLTLFSKVRGQVKIDTVSMNQEKRGPLLQKLLKERVDIIRQLEKTDAIDEVIDSLCSS